MPIAVHFENRGLGESRSDEFVGAGLGNEFYL